MLQRTRRLLQLALAVGALSGYGCGGGSSASSGPPGAGVGQGKGVTVMVYMNADNDLEPAALNDLKEMLQARAGANLNLLVEIDRAEKYSSDGVAGLPDFTTAKRLRVEGDRLAELADLGEVNASDPAHLAEFIGWGAKTAPASRYMLVLWDHGGGWTGFGSDETSTSGRAMPLAKLRQGVGDGMKAAGIARFDLIGFDACLMAAVETTQALDGYADYMLASEELEPSHGWDWTRLSALADNPALPTADFGKLMIEGYVGQAKAQKTLPQVTLSLSDLRETKPLVDALATLSARLNSGDLNRTQSELDRSRTKGLEFGKNPDVNRAKQMADLLSLAAVLEKERPDLAADLAAVKAALARVVVAKGSGDVYKAAGGLSIYVPSKKKYASTKGSYGSSPSMGFWLETLRALNEDAPPIAQEAMPRFTNPDNVADSTKGPGGELVISGQLAAGTFANISHARMNFAVYDADPPQNLIFVGDVGGETDDSGKATASWDGRVLQISQDGKEPAYGYASIDQEEGFYTLSVNIDFRPEPGAETQIAVLKLVLDAQGVEQSRDIYVAADSSGEQWAQIEPLPGSTFLTVLLHEPVPQQGQDAGEPEWKQSASEFDASAPFSVSFESILSDSSPTRVYLQLEATDSADNSDFIYYDGEL